MSDASEFYVGYLKMPPSLARFLRWVAPGLIMTGLAVAYCLSGSQNDPGGGVWHDEAQVLVGRVSATPYPMLRVPSKQPGGAVETVLLVSEGKHGAGERVAGMEGKIAKVRGTILERDGHRMLELADDQPMVRDDSPTAADVDRLPASQPPNADAPPRRVTLRGEIIDPKCYSGAMKPGEGKAHKECATLCISGGIPPMFVTFDAAGRRHYYLLTDSDGRALRGEAIDRLLPFVADAVEISGVQEQRGDLAILRVDLGRIRRL